MLTFWGNYDVTSGFGSPGELGPFQPGKKGLNVRRCRSHPRRIALVFFPESLFCTLKILEKELSCLVKKFFILYISTKR